MKTIAVFIFSASLVLAQRPAGNPPPAGPPASGPGSGTVTSVSTGCGLTGGPITGTGTIRQNLPGAAGTVQTTDGSGCPVADANLLLSTNVELLTAPNQKTSPPVAAPLTAPTAALAGAGAGNVDNGSYMWYVTFVNAVGETDPGPNSSGVTVVDNTMDGKVSLTAIPTGPVGTTARNIYRVIVWSLGAFWPGGRVGHIADNTTTVFTDNLATASITVPGTGMNTTTGGLYLNDGTLMLNNSLQTNYLNGCCGPIPVTSININTNGNGVAFLGDPVAHPENGSELVDIQLNPSGGLALNLTTDNIGMGLYTLVLANAPIPVDMPSFLVNVNYVNNSIALGAPVFGIQNDYATSSGQTNTPYIFACFNGDNGSGFVGGYSTAGGFCSLNTMIAPSDNMFEIAGTIYPAKAVASIRAAPSQSAPLLKFKASDDSDFTTAHVYADGTLGAGATTSDPGCTTTADIGKFWFNNTTNTTAAKKCVNVAGTLTWVSF